jgi:hypothetical protein
MGRISTLFLCSYRDKQRHCDTILQNSTWKSTRTQVDKHVLGDTSLDVLPDNAEVQQEMRYLIEIYVDDFMALVIPTTKKEVIHIGWAVMH